MNLSRPLAAVVALGALSMTSIAAADPNDPVPPPSPSPSTDSPDAQADALAKITLGVLGYSSAPQVAVPTTVAEPPPVPIPPTVDTVESPPVAAIESAPAAPEEPQRPLGVRADGSDAGEPQGALARAQGLSSRSSTQGYWRASAFYSPGK